MSVEELDDNEVLTERINEVLNDYKEEGPAALGKNVIVDVSHALPFLKARTLSSGIYIPAPTKFDDAHNKDSIPTDGVVVAVGPECTLINIGDHICLPLGNSQMFLLDWKGRKATKKYVSCNEDVVRARFD